MIDKVKTMESILRSLDDGTSSDGELIFEIVYLDGRSAKCPVKVPDPLVECALRIIKGEKTD